MEQTALMDQFALFAKVVGAMVLGGVIGFERDLSDRPAGFRTHMVVAGASALLVRLGEYVVRFYQSEGLSDTVDADPFRIIGAVVTGIAFLGAGTIIQKQSKMKVRGLTTAASLLFCGAIGIATALELWVFACLLTLATLFILTVLNRFEGWVERKTKQGDE
ncbi:MgtC/SapB family protein [Pelagicoccus sp. SDUM812003]|uniref:MgtC/SapB family protein n=1 Tax=Pelagicoccus sp. SDUM812003 TaxID=3041267 RepID=UPI00280CCF84|nr:MgtC/SapB family protein [Pelagicoccus sp. SDUM812003]MDQ8204015.1 MgtC/SapB family protein [Pelagicoccus sp. SDUM812003]